MDNRDKNYVSFWFWFFAIFVAAIPCVGIIMTFIWAFVGDNESRKNYFRALLAWALLLFVLWAVVFLLMGLGPVLLHNIEQWSQQAKPV